MAIRLTAALVGNAVSRLPPLMVVRSNQSGGYEAVAEKLPFSEALLKAEFNRTRPLSVVMSEKLLALRDWAKDRTVQANS